MKKRSQEEAYVQARRFFLASFFRMVHLFLSEAKSSKNPKKKRTKSQSNRKYNPFQDQVHWPQYLQRVHNHQKQ